MTLFVWLLLTLPQDKLICELWTRQVTQAALIQSCGSDALGAYRLDVVQENSIICSIPASGLNTVSAECGLTQSLDHYRLRIVKAGYQELIGCSVTTSRDVQPSAEEVRRQCPDAKNYQIKSGGTKVIKTEYSCKPPAVIQPASIATSNDYYLLAGRMIWYGFVKAECSGSVNGNLSATPCGLEAARPQMIAWQNSLDDAILRSSATWNVPAGTLKTLIANETQFWGWTGIDDEHGLIQVTDDGAALVMHFFQPGYYQLNPAKQYELRRAWLRSLDCEACTPRAHIDRAREMMDEYAKALAAYYCMYGSWQSALKNWNQRYTGG